MANYDITTAGAQFEIDGDWMNYPRLATIDENHFIIAWAGSASQADGFAQVITVNTSTWAVTTAGASFNFDASRGLTKDIIAIDSNHYLMCYDGSVSGRGDAVVLAVNTSTWEVTAANSELIFDGDQGQECSVDQIDDNHFIIFWKGAGANDGYVQVLTVNTSTWAVTTAAASLEFDTSNAGWNSAVKIDDNHFINFWSGDDQDGYVQVFEVNTSTWVVTTAAARVEFDTTLSFYNRALKIDDNHFINTWRGGGDSSSFMSQVFTVNTTTWAVTTAAASFDNGNVGTIQIGMVKLDDNHFLVNRPDVDTDGKATVLEVDTSTWAVSTIVSALEFDTQNCRHNWVWTIDSTHYLNIWEDGQQGVDNDGLIQVLDVDVPSAAPTFTPRAMVIF